jgi:hypothetical protein
MKPLLTAGGKTLVFTNVPAQAGKPAHFTPPYSVLFNHLS